MFLRLFGFSVLALVGECNVKGLVTEPDADERVALVSVLS